MNISEQSKLLAEYLGWKYFPNNDLQGSPKAGWYMPLSSHREQKINTKGLDSFIVDKIPYKYVCRNHNQLRFYNYFDELIPVLNKLTEEDLSEYMYSWERCVEEEAEVCYNFVNVDYYISVEFGTIIEINLELDPAMEIGRGQGEGIIKNTFNACVQAVEYINKRKK